MPRSEADADALLTALNAVLALHRPDAYGICEICRDGSGGPDIGAPCPNAAVAFGGDLFLFSDDG